LIDKKVLLDQEFEFLELEYIYDQAWCSLWLDLRKKKKQC